ncbi:MAG: hypothetical protein OHK0022_42910 [Roseiflexaceae bacterium]
MQFQIIDTESAYRRLLAAPDAAIRATIFRDEIYTPFAGLARFFGGTGPESFAQWGMSPELFADHARMAPILETLAQHRAWERAAEALERGRAAFAPFIDRIPLDTVVFGLMLVDMRPIPLQRGYSGFGAIPGWVMTSYGDPNDENLARVEAATVHELHHQVLSAAFPQRPIISTVGTYIIGEGLAESFAAELYGEELTGFWVREFDERELPEARRVIGAALDRSGFDVVRRYIFGDTIASHMGMAVSDGERVPDFAGYAIGYHVVQAYLRRTGATVAEATFVLPEQIIAESGFFQN